jgi:hypothetical protein
MRHQHHLRACHGGDGVIGIISVVSALVMGGDGVIGIISVVSALAVRGDGVVCVVGIITTLHHGYVCVKYISSDVTKSDVTNGA